MNQVAYSLENRETDFEGLDVVELGRASEETRGFFYGFIGDSGFGYRG